MSYNVNLWLPVISSASMALNIYVILKLRSQITPETMESSAATAARYTLLIVGILLSLMLAVIIFFLTTLNMGISEIAYLIPAGIIAGLSFVAAVGTFFVMRKKKDN